MLKPIKSALKPFLQALIQVLFKVRAFIIRIIKPKSGYFLFPTDKVVKSTEPISRKFGFDRGTPIDRYYIESFIKENAPYIKGVCLEIHDNYYTKKYGKNVTTEDVLDIDTTNWQATTYGDLRNLKAIKSNTYDCLIITQTFGVIDDYQAAVSECYRILKPGGSIIGSATSIGAISNLQMTYWRFAVPSIKYVFGKCFDLNKLTIKTYGNVLAGQCSWVGLAAEELTKEELDVNDPYFSMVIGFRATK